MGEFWRIFAVILITSGIAIADNNTCRVSKYSDKCSCYNESEEFFVMDVMDCTSNITENVKSSFQIHYVPGLYVGITCVNNPDWSAFDYDISSVTDKVVNFQLTNCNFKDNVNLGQIAKLVGADEARNLQFNNTLGGTDVFLSGEQLNGFSNISTLSIYGNNDNKNLDKDLLQYLPQLTYLHLRYNGYESIPDNFFQHVPNLESLGLTSHNISKLTAETFKNLRNLRFLNIFSEALQVVESNTFDDLVSLEVLHLHVPNLKMLPQGIFDKLVQLREVYVSGSDYEVDFRMVFEPLVFGSTLVKPDVELKTLPSGLFSNLKNLKIVHFDGFFVESLPEDLFHGSTELDEIHLEGNALKTLPVNIFQGLEKLRILHLFNNKIEDLPDNIFSSCKNLKELNLSRNKITKISNSLFSGLESLLMLSMERNNLVNIEKNAFAACKNVIERINLYGNNIEDLRATVTVDSCDVSIFADLKKLQLLDLSYNRIRWMCKDWMTSPSIKVLNVHHNAMLRMRV